MSAPPMSGPTKRAPFIITELSAMALGRSLFPPTSSSRIDWRAGALNALTMPSTRFPAMKCQGLATPNATTRNIAAACAAAIQLVATSTPRRSSRSTKTPASGARTKNRSEEHTSELQSQSNLVCRLLLEKKKKKKRDKSTKDKQQ